MVAAQPVEHRRVVGSMLDAGPLQHPADGFQALVHRVHIGYVRRRPEPLGNRRQPRPDARIHRLRARQLRPHARLAAQNVASLLGGQLRRVAGQRLDAVMKTGRAEVIQVVAPRQDAAIALPHRFGQRRASAPGLNHGARTQSRLQDLVPADHGSAVPRQDLTNALAEIQLDVARVLEPVLFGKRLNVRRLAPLLAVHFVAAHVEIRVGEERCHFADKAVQEAVGFLAARIHHRIEHAVVAAGFKGARPAGQLRIAGKPARGVARHVELGHHADPALARVSHHGADFGLRIVMAAGTELLQTRIAFALHAKALVVGEVPVEDVQLHRGHRIQVALHHLDRHPMARNVHQQPAPREARPVVNAHRWRLEAGGSGLDQLRESFQPVQRAIHSGGLQQRPFGRDRKLVGFILAQGWIQRATCRAFHAQRGVRAGGRLAARNGHAGLARKAGYQPVQRALEAWVGQRSGYGELLVNRQRARARFQLQRQRHQRRRVGGAGAKARNRDG